MLFVPRQVALAASSSSSRPPAAAAPAAAAGVAMAKEESKKEKKSKGKSKAAVPDARAVVVASVAAFLEAGGFPRALAALQTEANLEAGAWRSSAVSLEELVSKFLESSAAPRAVNVASNEQAEDASKKKKDGATELNGTGNDVTAPSIVNEEDETGEKKKKKKKNKGGAEASEPETKVVEPSTEEKPAENADVDTKEKKHKKKKKDKDDASAGEAKETMKSDDQKVDGKKKKSKKQEEDDDDIEARLEKASLAIEKKKKEKKSASEASENIDAGTAAAEADGKSGAVETGKDDKDKKSKKKRKKSGSEENGQVDGKEVKENGSVPKSDNDNKSGMDVEGENGKPSGDNAVVGKKRKLEDVKGSDTPATENGTAHQNLSNGFAEDDSKENGTASKPSKRQKKSAEPKSVTPFQRVKLDAVKFADERLQDNSYWAKGGAEIGYGAKAQEVLGQVRGRGFRHEKTKKKRGTYRGGQIDLGTHSIKFNNSDDEE